MSIWFYSSRGTQCCAEIRNLIDTGAGQSCGAPYVPPADDASGCPPVGPCLGFTGSCADLQQQFIALQGCYVYGGPGDVAEHAYLDDYVCHAFPDDAYVTDQFFVSLIAVAVALPVDLVIARAFEIANEIDTLPEAWLDAPPGKWRLLLGKNAHRDWHLADPARPVSDLTLWLVRYSWETAFASFFRLLAWLWRHARGQAARAAESNEKEAKEGSEAGSEEEEEDVAAEAAGDALAKRLYSAAGLLTVYICWAVFSWCVGLCLRHGRQRLTSHASPAPEGSSLCTA